MSDKLIKLTATQILQLEELYFDQTAVEATLKTAMVYHSNRMGEISKELGKWWKEIAEIHELDLDKKEYKIDRINSVVMAVENDP